MYPVEEVDTGGLPNLKAIVFGPFDLADTLKKAFEKMPILGTEEMVAGHVEDIISRSAIFHGNQFDMMKIRLSDDPIHWMRNICKLFVRYFGDINGYQLMMRMFGTNYWEISRSKVRGLLASTVVRFYLYDRWREERTVRSPEYVS
jgi:hypothetical protein